MRWQSNVNVSFLYFQKKEPLWGLLLVDVLGDDSTLRIKRAVCDTNLCATNNPNGTGNCLVIATSLLLEVAEPIQC
jgi:hypothetical protein